MFDYAKLVAALTEFVTAVDVTDGVTLDAFGNYHPGADPHWIDLGAAYLTACAALNRPPVVNGGPGDASTD